MRTKFNLMDESLCEAVLDGDLEQVQIILNEYDGNVNAQNKYGMTPALLAAKRNDLEILEYLVGKGADLKLSDGLNQTPMDWAEHNKNEKMIDFINEHTTQSYMKR
ncbi:ankyrin repeat domain-containing protein [Fluoribacter gormanii]|uniref:Ankyrin n=1 Tax=Fluoribacter gormanii TaxID=464 RepID=A0A377GMR0_9GAMM|nr:ankyrin repeat domain-containing protein [Fluoribacter gormanii]KTD04973.1 ankyrin repeat protein [Fluoribacter gormanii]MCW8442790.1 ankyrin repeat domain-containing protein [Fluoribacter gormanii]MCW8471263.1 ankyrin repeat domain-containing protein [Fluoribacter gormanii]SIR54938.1 ankyrin [Fluoribacter gormanii]STO25602.1 Ribulose-5-phosphate 4-epimerase and related epimerases and aldolases [Fluoribacter gormanii]